MTELKRVSKEKIVNYYNSYVHNEKKRAENRKKARLSWEDIRKAPLNRDIFHMLSYTGNKEAALNWAIGIHGVLFGTEQLNEAIEDYKKLIDYLESST